MSILLESLKQPKTPDEGDVPSLADSHFDDEMLSDEWLLEKIKFWRLVAIGLLILVAISSSFYLYYFLSTENKIVQLQAELELINTSKEAVKQTSVVSEKDNEASKLNEQDLTEKVNSSSVSNSIDSNSSVSNISVSNNKQKYQPTKQKLITEKTASPVAPVQEKVHLKNVNLSSKPVEFESLSEQEKAEIPDLEINSYAVSSNEKKSFVVLNGSFYGQGETIAPYLVLVTIDKEGIVIRHKNKLIRKKYSID